MKTIIGIAALTAAVTIGLSAPAQAGCTPACKKGETCRYDSTKTPEFWCEATGSKVISPKKTLPSSGGGKKPAATSTSTGK